ncbi:Ribosomal protein S27 family protein [Leishmania donovani]|uniref:Ribosomal protein S27 family protein n=1 Tax=Leishmania donovani TaxID=5661 RepID=A0A504YCB0_LEIDO|nr:Ribosomal protein S27 family protein [Leishmania donovani]
MNPYYHKPFHAAPGEPAPPSYDALNGGYSSAPPPAHHAAASEPQQLHNGNVSAFSSSSPITPGTAPPLQPQPQQQQYGADPRLYGAYPAMPANGMAPAAPPLQQQPQVYGQPQPQPMPGPVQQQQSFVQSSSVSPSGAAAVAGPTTAAGVGSGAAPSRSAEEEDRLQPGYTAPASAEPPAQPQQQQHQPRPAATPSQVNAGVTDWQCGMCLAPNEAHAERCKVCYAYRSSGIPVPTVSPSGAAANANHNGVASNTPFTTNWKCSVCGEVNPPSKANCKVCSGFQRNGTAVTDAVPAPSTGSGYGAQATSSADPPLPMVWSCSVCTFENSVSAAVCKACESGQRPRHLAPKRDKEKSTSSKQHDSRVSGAKDGSGDGEKKCSSSKSQWPCGTCTFLNPIGRKKCDMCGAKRPESYAAEADTTEARAAAKQEAQDDAEEVAWQDDDSVTECNNCHTTFTFLIRRHHCRLCGYVFCAHCSNYSVPLTMGSLPQRRMKHKRRRLVQGPNSYFMDVSCPRCRQVTVVYSHATTSVECKGCSKKLCRPTGGKALLVEGCGYRRKPDH